MVTLREFVVGRGTQRALLVLLAAIGFVLLIATANLANLLLNRAATRAREFSIRSALGASTSRLIQQVLIETGVLCVVGAVAAIFVAYAIIKAVIAYGPSSIPRLAETSIDLRVLIFTLGVSALTAALFAPWLAFEGSPDAPASFGELLANFAIAGGAGTLAFYQALGQLRQPGRS